MRAQTQTMTACEVKEASPSLISADDLRRLEQLDRDWEEGSKALEQFGAAFADEPSEKSETEIARIIAEIRRQDDAEAEAERKPA